MVFDLGTLNLNFTINIFAAVPRLPNAPILMMLQLGRIG